jgi:hypothetical protein
MRLQIKTHELETLKFKMQKFESDSITKDAGI